DLLPSSPGERLAAPRTVTTAALVQWNGGSAPVAKCRIEGVSGKICPPGTLRRHVSGAGPLSGEGPTMRDPELVARAQRPATRWNRHGNNGAHRMDLPWRPGSRSSVTSATDLKSRGVNQ